MLLEFQTELPSILLIYRIPIMQSLPNGPSLNGKKVIFKFESLFERP